jgi:hypothetical protein
MTIVFFMTWLPLGAITHSILIRAALFVNRACDRLFDFRSPMV